MRSPKLFLLFCLISLGLKQTISAQTINEKWHQNQDAIEEYYQSNRLKEARSLIIYNLDFAEHNFSPKSEEYRSSIFYLAQLYQAENNYKSAEQTYKKTEELFQLMKEVETLEYGILLGQMANFYTKNRRYEVADSLFKKSLKHLERVAPKEKEDYANVLKDQAAFYYEKGDYDLAIASYSVLERKYKKYLPHFEFMSLLLDLGAVYESMSRYEEALACYKKCSSLKTKGRKDLNENVNKDGMMALAISGEARSLEQLGNFKAAQTAFSTVYSLYNNRTKDPESKDEGIHEGNFRCFLDEYASFYEHIGDYQTAKMIYQKIDSLGGTALQSGVSKANQALLYEAMGEYPLAEQYYLEALEIFGSLEREGNAPRAHANCLLNLAGLYEIIGRYKASEKLYLEAKQIDEMTIGREHLDYAATLNNLAKLYVSIQKYEKAEEYYDYAERILENRLSNYHPRYIRSLSNRAFLYQLQERYELAEEIYKEVLKTQRKLVGKIHPDYVHSMGQLAGLYKLKGEATKAERYYKKVLKTQLEIYGEEHPEYAARLNEYAQLQHYLGNSLEALHLFLKSNQVFIQQLQEIYPILSEQERMKFFSKLEPHFDAFYSFASDYIGSYPDLVLELQNIHLLIKGLGLETTIKSKGNAIFGGDDELKSLYEKWESTKKEVAQLYSKSLQSITVRTNQLDSLMAIATDLEIQLSKRSLRFKIQLQSDRQTQLSFADLERKLDEDEVVIDFLCFNYFNGRVYTNEKRYAAFLSRSGMSQPQWIDLGTEKELGRLLNRNMTQRAVNYTTNKQIGQQLYQQLWLPFETLLNGVKKVHLSAAGILHKVSFSALPTDSLFLLNRYQLLYHSNLRDFILSEELERATEKRIFLMGNPSFSLHPGLLPKGEKKKKGEGQASIQIFGEQVKGHFYELDGTEREINRIHALFDSSGWQSQTYLADVATEEQVKDLGDKPQILHLATHGYFFPNMQKMDSIYLQQSSFQKRMRNGVNPLLRSGLAFAGANYVWRGRKIPADREDGILMAYEVANMDLFGVELVTLSACNTGRGDLHNSEGVLGLQRAFKAAGAKHLILSLWRVPDQETADLMEVFYQNYLKGMSLEKAFRRAQLELSKSYPPFYWAGFIFVN